MPCTSPSEFIDPFLICALARNSCHRRGQGTPGPIDCFAWSRFHNAMLALPDGSAICVSAVLRYMAACFAAATSFADTPPGMLEYVSRASCGLPSEVYIRARRCRILSLVGSSWLACNESDKAASYLLAEMYAAARLDR